MVCSACVFWYVKREFCVRDLVGCVAWSIGMRCCVVNHANDILLIYCRENVLTDIGSYPLSNSLFQVHDLPLRKAQISTFYVHERLESKGQEQRERETQA